MLKNCSPSGPLELSNDIKKLAASCSKSKQHVECEKQTNAVTLSQPRNSLIGSILASSRGPIYILLGSCSKPKQSFDDERAYTHSFTGESHIVVFRTLIFKEVYA